MDGAYILQGDECLVFFLGGIPLQDPATGHVRHDRLRQGSRSIRSRTASPPTATRGNATRCTAPTGSRRCSSSTRAGSSSIPTIHRSALNGLIEPGNSRLLRYSGQLAPDCIASTTLNFYVYFSGYGNGVYDANDVNFQTEVDGNGTGPIGLNFQHAGTVYPSLYPNPYTTTRTITTSGTVTFQKAQTFQIFSSGADGLYGVGGQFIAADCHQLDGQQPAAVRLDQYVCRHGSVSDRRDAQEDANATTSPTSNRERCNKSRARRNRRVSVLCRAGSRGRFSQRGKTWTIERIVRNQSSMNIPTETGRRRAPERLHAGGAVGGDGDHRDHSLVCAAGRHRRRAAGRGARHPDADHQARRGPERPARRA